MLLTQKEQVSDIVTRKIGPLYFMHLCFDIKKLNLPRKRRGNKSINANYTVKLKFRFFLRRPQKFGANFLLVLLLLKVQILWECRKMWNKSATLFWSLVTSKLGGYELCQIFWPSQIIWTLYRIHATAKRILERLGLQTSSSFMKIW